MNCFHVLEQGGVLTAGKLSKIESMLLVCLIMSFLTKKIFFCDLLCAAKESSADATQCETTHL